MNIFQKLGLFFYETIDRTGFLFAALKSVHRLYRYGFYIFFLTSCYFFNSQLFTMIENPIFKPALEVFNMTILIFLSLITCYESLFDVDVAAILEEKKKKREYIKWHKLQWWRLRNMNMFYRFCFYIFLYAVLQQVIILNSLLSVQNISFSKSEYELFLGEIKQIMHYFTFVYIMAALCVEYFAGKNRKKQLILKEWENEKE
jgi:hypothetical protein